MANPQLDEALKDVTKLFETPEAILESADFGKTEKIKLLQQWEIDLRALLVASEENMTGSGQGNTAERLQAVRAALSVLGIEAKEETGVPNKAGA